MSEKRFELLLPNAIINDTIVRKSYYLSEKDDVEKLVDELNELSEENEQLRQQLQEYKENWDDMVEMATKTSLRNVELDEQMGQLKAQLREKEEDERLYADEIVKLNKEAKEVLDFKSLGGDY